MHRHILLGIAAWLLGAATATAGSLLAVSLLGSGITGNSGQLLTQDAVNRELTSEAAKTALAGSSTSDASTEPSPTSAFVTPPSVPTSASPTPSLVPTTATPGGTGSASSGTVLVSSAGEVVATCQAAGAYLVSWSPLQGYEVDDVSRGPAATARVTFESHTDQVTMTVSCSAGIPSATSHTWSGGDD